MEFVQLATFLSVIEHRSFSRAAKALGISQSTVSFHIKALEASVGSRLLDRDSGTATPTPAGKVLRRNAERMLALREESLARLREEPNPARGTVRIAASTIPGDYLLPRYLGEFRRDFPEVRIHLEISDSAAALEHLLAHECDIAISGARSTDKRIVQTLFASDEIHLVAPVRSTFLTGDRLTPKQLARLPIVARESGSGTRRAVERLIPGSAGDEASCVLEVSSSEAVRRCLLAGAGVGFLSTLAIREDLKAKRLKRIHFPGTPVKRDFYVQRLRSVTISAAAGEFLERLTAKA